MQHTSSTMTFSSAALSDASLEVCVDNYKALKGFGALVKEKRTKEMACPGPLEQADYESVRATSLLAEDWGSPTEPLSDVLKRVSMQRDIFADAVFELTLRDGSSLYWRFVFSLQKPMFVYFLPLTREGVGVQLDTSTLVGRDVHSNTGAIPTMRWSYDHNDLASLDPFRDDAISSVAVYLKSPFYVPGGFVLTFDVPYPLESLPLPTSGKTAEDKTTQEPPGKRAKKGASVRAEVLESHPWVADFMEAVNKNSRPAGSSEGTGDATKGGMRPVSACETVNESSDPLDDVFMQTFQALDEQRQQEQGNDDTDLFAYTLLGGAWQIKRTGRALYGHRVDIRKETVVRTFAEHFAMPCSASFEFSKFSAKGSALMVRLWSRRMHALAVAWDNSDRPADMLDRRAAVEFDAEDIMEDLRRLVPPAGRKRMQETLDLWPSARS